MLSSLQSSYCQENAIFRYTLSSHLMKLVDVTINCILYVGCLCTLCQPRGSYIFDTLVIKDATHP